MAAVIWLGSGGVDVDVADGGGGVTDRGGSVADRAGSVADRGGGVVEIDDDDDCGFCFGVGTVSGCVGTFSGCVGFVVGDGDGRCRTEKPIYWPLISFTNFFRFLLRTVAVM